MVTIRTCALVTQLTSTCMMDSKTGPNGENPDLYPNYAADECDGHENWT